ncbi:hypothetical protein E4U41_003172 [Claviceps citrina]|nr:hypothetical protein E4U41_003172 [Claviceps citrina]
MLLIFATKSLRECSPGGSASSTVLEVKLLTRACPAQDGRPSAAQRVKQQMLNSKQGKSILLAGVTASKTRHPDPERHGSKAYLNTCPRAKLQLGKVDSQQVRVVR